jgi:diguanylate cyclase (GGDEF)-like protein
MSINSTLSTLKYGVRFKAMLVLLIVLLTALSVSTWLTLQQEKQTILERINQRGSDISRFVAKSLSFSVVGYDYHTIQLLTDEITLSDDVGYAKVTSIKGNIMAESGSLRSNGEASMVMFEEDIMLEDNKVGSLKLGFSTEKTVKHLEEHKYTLIMREALIILLIAIGEFIALSYIIIRPIRRMTNSLSGSVNEEGRIVRQLPVLSNDEFGRMATIFNSLSTQLNKANDRLHSKIQLADKELLKTNSRLQKQSKELEIINQEFKELSITDPLTGIYNRRHFVELMKNDVEMTRRHGYANSMLLIDIDHFKVINDNHGHPCGDKVLVDISGILKSNLRQADSICRIGGEEFAVMCRRMDIEDAKNTAEKLRALTEATTINCGEHSINITISIGISTISGKDSKLDQQGMYRQADMAVYGCKDSGRNQIMHYDDINDDDKSV